MNKKCQVFTPSDYVEKLLDCVSYKHDLYGKRIMENSCGDGRILEVIVQRYIDDCRAAGFSCTKIKNGLAKDINGAEIDPEQFKICVSRLDEIVKQNNIGKVDWNIACDDYLKMDDQGGYDYVVGNPPYITYSELKEKDQEYLRDSFSSCEKGKFDYCYAFLEKSLDSLSAHGRMAYLIPSSVYKTVFGEAIRKKMLPYVEEVIDYTQAKLFQNALIKSSIIVMNKEKNNTLIHYVDESSDVEKFLDKKNLKNKWIFSQINQGDKRFGDYFKVSHVVATLCNEAFVLKEWHYDEAQNYICDGFVLENNLVRDAVSPKNMHTGHREKIIFPYTYDNNHKLIKYSEDEFAKLFPGGYKYLKRFREKLDKRKSDSIAKWFEYGRSQALRHLDSDKVLISTIISNEVAIYRLNRRAIPYSGMYVVALSDQMSIDNAVDVLQADEFLEYVKIVGVPINGKSVRITSKDIENYRF